MPSPKRPKGRYFRISPQFWIDNDWNDDTLVVALYLLTCPHRNTEGLFRFSPPQGAEDLTDRGPRKWSVRRFSRAFDALIADGFIEYDATARVVFIVNALQWQSPDNENHAISAVRRLKELPTTHLLTHLRWVALTHSTPLAKAMLDEFGDAVSEPMPHPLSLPLAQPPKTSSATQPRTDSTGLGSDGKRAA